jgi:chorismate-pyruvate lyase
LKRKRPIIDIYNLSKLHKALVKTEAKLGFKIPPLLLVVIIQNGVLESILHLLVRNAIKINIVSQRESGSMLYRKICVRKKPDGAIIMHAESRIETKNLPSVLLDGIFEGEKGIGCLIENLRVETFRSIKNIGYDRRRRAIYRIYDIYIKTHPAITIKEYFPIDLPLWNSWQEGS